ncbi:hypothetical protein [Patulibacter minatonensis]|uniref:hypothetical protein n=1 Tax=Patulibacter minatonensis TaxID=298163 RepID=UPI0004799BC7|nr:hypothetical protein [Patulibacter minatonensis]
MSTSVTRPREIVLPPWEMTTMAELVYRRLGPWTYPDADNGFALAALVDAITSVAGWVDEVARVGYEALLDPARCPWWALRWCGQAYGVRLLPRLQPFERPTAAIESAWRQEIASRPRWRRGHPDTIIAAARRHMAPGGAVTLRERYDPALGASVDAPYHFQVRIRASDVLPGHNDLIVRDVLAAKPVRLIAHIVIADDQTWDDLVDERSSWNATVTAYPTWNDAVAG